MGGDFSIMSKMTIGDLRQKQALPLEAKLSHPSRELKNGMNIGMVKYISLILVALILLFSAISSILYILMSQMCIVIQGWNILNYVILL